MTAQKMVREEYLKRTWTIQEVVLARDVVVVLLLLGDALLSWRRRAFLEAVLRSSYRRASQLGLEVPLIAARERWGNSGGGGGGVRPELKE